MPFHKIDNGVKERALQLIAEGWPIERVIEAIGVSRRSIGRWTDNYDFVQRPQVWKTAPAQSLGLPLLCRQFRWHDRWFGSRVKGRSKAWRMDLGFGQPSDAFTFQGYEVGVEVYKWHLCCYCQWEPRAQGEELWDKNWWHFDVSFSQKLTWSVPDILLGGSLSVLLRDDSSSVSSTSWDWYLFGNGSLRVLTVVGEEVRKSKSELINYGLGISLEGLIELYDSVEEWNGQNDFVFKFFDFFN